jgi:hypothetical protein
MSHSHVSNLMHCTFSTKERFPCIEPELESRRVPLLLTQPIWSPFSYDRFAPGFAARRELALIWGL